MDGFQAVFYQQCWHIVGNFVLDFVLSILRGGRLLEEINTTLSALVPKILSPEVMSHFRPISICNLIYKLIMKVVVNRLKPILLYLINPQQGSFISGRQITDNVILFQEALHSMHNIKGQQGWMLVKVDLENAYHTINWDFLCDTLLYLMWGFPGIG